MIKLDAINLQDTIDWLGTVNKRCDIALERALSSAPSWRIGARAVAESALHGAAFPELYEPVIQKFLDTIISAYESNCMAFRGYFVLPVEQVSVDDEEAFTLTGDVDPAEISDDDIDAWIEAGKLGADGGKRIDARDYDASGQILPTEVIRSRIRNGIAKDPFSAEIQRLISSVVAMRMTEYGVAVASSTIEAMTKIVIDAWEDMIRDQMPSVVAKHMDETLGGRKAVKG